MAASPQRRRRARPPASSAAVSATPLTGWIDAGVAPRRVGVYRRRAPAGPYSCWDGRAWYADAATPARAAAGRTPSRFSAAWRGLARAAPAGACPTCRGHGVIDHGFDAETGRDRIVECPACADSDPD